MSEPDGAGADLPAPLAGLLAAVDGLQEWSVSSCSTEHVHAALRLLQAAQTRLRLEQVRVLSELGTRPAADGVTLRGPVELVEVGLRADRREATRLAGDLIEFGARRSLIGPNLAPQFPRAAAALAEAAITFSHARVISECITGLPISIRTEHADRVEAVLTEQARTLSPTQLRKLGRRVTAHLDPDGPAPTDHDQRDRRAFSWLRQPDGTVTGRFTLTVPTAAIWETLLTPLAVRHPSTPDATPEQGDRAGDSGAPGLPADPVTADRRTAQQRWHDGFEDAGRRLLTARDVPDHAGLPATLLLTMNLRDLERRAGTATTHHGGRLSIPQALQLATDATLLPLIMNDSGGIVDHGRERRLASRRQRLALIARDRGCTFPGCARPAADAQAHHLTSWADGGPTNLSNLALACGYHNNNAPRWGWTSALIDGVAHWTAPPWLDPSGTPRRNYQHHPELLLRPARTASSPPNRGRTSEEFAETDDFTPGPESYRMSSPTKEVTMPTPATRIRSISLVCVPTPEQDRAIEFYESLGFEKRTDTPFGGDYRWIEVYPPQGETGIALAPPPPDGGPVVPTQTGITLTTDDIDATHAEMKARGVDVDVEVSRMGDPVPPMFWFRDPTGHVLMVVEQP